MLSSARRDLIVLGSRLALRQFLTEASVVSHASATRKLGIPSSPNLSIVATRSVAGNFLLFRELAQSYVVVINWLYFLKTIQQVRM